MTIKTYAQLLETKIDLTGVRMVEAPRIVTHVSPFSMTGKEVLEGIAQGREIIKTIQEAIEICERKLAEAQGLYPWELPDTEQQEK